MNYALVELYRHKTWARPKLIELCGSLEDADVDATTPGTYGRGIDGPDLDVWSYADMTGNVEHVPVADP